MRRCFSLAAAFLVRFSPALLKWKTLQPTTGGHLNQGSRLGLSEGVLKVFDGFDLGWPQSLLSQRWNLPDSGFYRCTGMIDFGTQPVGQGLRPVEGKEITACRVRLQQIGKPGLHASALITEWQGTAWSGQGLRHALTIFGGLNLIADESAAFLLGFNYARPQRHPHTAGSRPLQNQALTGIPGSLRHDTRRDWHPCGFV